MSVRSHLFTKVRGDCLGKYLGKIPWIMGWNILFSHGNISQGKCLWEITGIHNSWHFHCCRNCSQLLYNSISFPKEIVLSWSCWLTPLYPGFPHVHGNLLCRMLWQEPNYNVFLDSLQDNFWKSQTGIKLLTVGFTNGVAMKMWAWRICFTTCNMLTTELEFFVEKYGYFSLHPRTLSPQHFPELPFPAWSNVIVFSLNF